MSLTSELSRLDSFARCFIDERFPHLKAISRNCNASLRKQGFKKLASIHDHKIVSMLVGTALDYRVRAYFNRHMYDTESVMRGLAFLCNLKEFEKPYIDPVGGSNIEETGDGWYGEELEVIANPWYWRRRRRVAERLVSSFENLVAKVKPERRKLTVEAENKVCRFCILFAYLDWIGRSPSGNSAFELMVRLGNPNVSAMLRAVDPRIVADLVLLSAQFYKQQRALLKRFKQATAGGTFAGATDVGGADFDLIVDGCLIDLKTMLQPKITTAHLRQLVGYWLLDYDDTWHITSVAVILARHAHTQYFDIHGDLIGPNANAANLRQEFRLGLQRQTLDGSRPLLSESEILISAQRPNARQHRGDPFDVGPGHQMPQCCPKCRAANTLIPIEFDADEMSEGQEADYQAGVFGTAHCTACKFEFDWGM